MSDTAVRSSDSTVGGDNYIRHQRKQIVSNQMSSILKDVKDCLHVERGTLDCNSASGWTNRQVRLTETRPGSQNIVMCTRANILDQYTRPHCWNHIQLEAVRKAGGWTH